MRFVSSMLNLVFMQGHFDPKFWDRATVCVLEGKKHAKRSWTFFLVVFYSLPIFIFIFLMNNKILASYLFIYIYNVTVCRSNA